MMTSSKSQKFIMFASETIDAKYNRFEKSDIFFGNARYLFHPSKKIAIEVDRFLQKSLQKPQNLWGLT
jgi:hypothetical protein